MSNYPNYKPLVCPRCDEIRTTMDGLRIHLIMEHGLSNDEAYDEAGRADSESDEPWRAPF